ncbi:hypothetical protein [Streptomyces sp. NPDC089919]|uniref:hypothetical protein n=1 Tax=Streptomyces sp. NPDC089919 TaxID=3155188 RepID=UPI003439618C
MTASPEDGTGARDPRVPYARPPGAEDEYSATVLGSHWFDGPAEAGHPATVRAGAEPATVPLVPVPAAPEAVPDRVEGSVLRFGPGVTASAVYPAGIGTTAVWHGGTLGGPDPAAGPARPARGAGLRRYALAALVLLLVLMYLGWQRYGPAMTVRSLAVQAPAGGPACDSAAEVVAVVRTDGRPGTLRYRWLRNDGTRSPVLTERMPQGRQEARLRLLWTFHGEGSYRARAELHLLAPQQRTAAAEFTYRCG